MMTEQTAYELGQQIGRDWDMSPANTKRLRRAKQLKIAVYPTLAERTAVDLTTTTGSTIDILLVRKDVGVPTGKGKDATAFLAGVMQGLSEAALGTEPLSFPQWQTA